MSLRGVVTSMDSVPRAPFCTATIFLGGGVKTFLNPPPLAWRSPEFSYCEVGRYDIAHLLTLLYVTIDATIDVPNSGKIYGCLSKTWEQSIFTTLPLLTDGFTGYQSPVEGAQA